MQLAFATVLAFVLVAIAFMLGSLLAGKLLRPNKPGGQKLDPYECGEAPTTQAWFNFNPRFYVVALIFLIFDVEIALVYPVAVVFKRWVIAGLAAVAFCELFAFVGVLALGLAYVWRKGDLEWMKTVTGAVSPKLQVHKSLAGEKEEA